ncbi:MAG: hypothetical protein QF632_05715 [Candidatus Woesearchaeota archaeon]|jgi:orotate phosphoribosyltransferase|nr:hypothetical protein [Candidatus Woesearchaeota archaeon]MDP7324229.1 hypothetical protein [Candidatus Woesearchaeota archaeon]MDP7457566.1 hypothetical protein [Candidatus Woesearchaeota archaeon]
MEKYQEEFTELIAGAEGIFFADDLKLKDGRPTPYFINMGVFGEKASLTNKLGKYYAAMIKEQIDKGMKIDIIFGPSYKGSAIAFTTAMALLQDHNIDLGVAYDRKEAKTHGEGSSAKDILVGAKIKEGDNIFIVDDVTSSMKTKYDMITKLQDVAKGENFKYNIVGIGLGVNREQTTPAYENPEDIATLKVGEKGENAVEDFSKKTNIPVFFVMGVREMVDYLFKNKIPILVNNEKKPIDESTKAKFDDYLETYGT